MQDAYEFLNEKFRGEKGEKNYFFVNSTEKMVMFFTHIYIYDNNNKNIYMFIYKKKFKKMSTSF